MRIDQIENARSDLTERIVDLGDPERGTERIDCSIVVEILSKRWAIRMLELLHEQPQRRKNLKLGLAGINSDRLDATRDVLLSRGLIRPAFIDGARHPEPGFEITRLGESLLCVTATLSEWQRASLPQLQDSLDSWRTAHPHNGR